MNMPNRVAEVAAICAAHPEAFPQGEQNDPARLVLLQTVIIPTLNAIDGGQWGCMTKTEQGNKVPCDILMWKPTGEFTDCLTGTGAFWNPFPPAPPEWVWTAVAGSAPAPGPVPDPAQLPSENDFQILVDLLAAVNANTLQLDALTKQLASALANGIRIRP